MVQEVYPGADMDAVRKRPFIPEVQKKQDAVLSIMQLAIYGAMMKPREEEDIYTSLEDVLNLFKEAGLIK